MVYKVNTIELKKLMIENNFDTIESLADAMGTSRNTVSDVLSGKRRPSTAVMDKFIIALHMQPQTAGIIFFVPDLRNA